MKMLKHILLISLFFIQTQAHSQSVKANGVGVNGTSRIFDAYYNAAANKYLMIDVSKPMFVPTRPIPSDTGQIIILDAKNVPSPQPKDFVLIESNSTTFTDPIAVDALYHFEKAYDFFNQNFGLLSYDNQKSSLRAVVHYKTNNEEAFWSDTKKYFYFGDGDNKYKPLASGYDIVARTLAEAIITSQSLLASGEYNQTGAALESIKDIFAVAADSANWTIGETVTKVAPNFINSIQNPHQGLAVTDEAPYSQPEQMNEFVYSLFDNGGVHINSGILNKAAFNLAQSIGRKNMAQVFYKALPYLKSDANFFDIRNACESAARDLSIPVSTIDAAFDAVGITGKTRIETELLTYDFELEDAADYTPLPYLRGGVAMLKSPEKFPSQVMRIGFYVGDGNTGKKVRIRFYTDANGTPSTIISELQHTITDDLPHWEMKDVRTNNIIVNGDFHLAIMFDGSPVGVAFDPFAFEDRTNEFNGSSWQPSQSTYYIRSHVQRVIAINDVEKLSTASSFELYQNHPNPIFKSSENKLTTFSFSLSQSMHVRLKVVDVLGRDVALIQDDLMNEGMHEVVFDASRLTPGVYFYRLENGKQISTRKMIVK